MDKKTREAEFTVGYMKDYIDRIKREEAHDVASRQTYEDTAEILRDHRDKIEEPVYESLVREFALAFREDNPRFNDKTFALACGLEGSVI